jgi:hypothetical protein
MKMRTAKNMKIRWAVAGFLTLLVLAGIEIVSVPPRRAQAQAVGYVASGQQAVTTTAAVVAGISYGDVCIKALNGNSIPVYLGGAGVDVTGMELAPGNVYCAPGVNAGEFFVIASTTGAAISWVQTR